ncbi:MAG: hypothetical protein II612_06765 [Prevotella sp.]|nr:hypothetical protein [Prevotella sp.]
MKKGFFKLALVSAMAFVCATADAQAQAPQWAQEQATVQQIGPGMTVGAKGWDGNNEILYQIVAVNPEFELVQEEFGETTKSFDYEVKVIGVSPAFASKTGDAAAINILFEDQIKTTTVKITSIEKIECLDLMKMKPTTDALTNITKLTVGYSKRANQPEYNQCKAGITSIADGALTGLTGLTDIVTYNTEPITVSETSFPEDAFANIKVTVPKDAKGIGTVGGKFVKNDVWRQFAKEKNIYVNGALSFFCDFNCDNRFNTTDNKKLVDYYNSDDEYTGKANLLSRDINGDGRFNLSDAKKLLDYYNEE